MSDIFKVKSNNQWVGLNAMIGPQGEIGPAAGFGTPTASVDSNVGTPAVTITSSGPDTAKVFDFAFSNLKGETGDTGAAAGFGTPTATIDANVGTPSVTVTSSGPNTAKVFDFAFSSLKGDKGDTGPQGPKGNTGNAAGFGTPTARIDANVGTPSVTISANGPNTAKVFDFVFSNLKGDTGDAAGFGTPTASVDSNVGTPSVTITSSGQDTAKVFDFAFSNLKGETGATGAAAGIGTVTATLTTLGRNDTPTVSASVSGPDTAKNFTFNFGLPVLPQVQTVVIYDYQWNFDTNIGKYKVHKSILGVTASSFILAGPKPIYTDEAFDKVIYCSGQGDGYLEFSAYDQPTSRIDFGVYIL